MRVFLIAAISVDGYIAPADKASLPSTSWTSNEDKKFFIQRTKEAGVIIMGSRTYETIGRPLPGRHTVVYSDSTSYEGVETTAQDPRALLADLEKRGYKEVAICGGAAIYTMFIKAGLIDTLYLTVEPVVFGSGIRLFSEEVRANLILEELQKVGSNAIRLTYRVIHS